MTDPHITFVVPQGAFGASDADDLLDKAMRQIGVAVSKDPQDEWAEKYGSNFENGVFMMHRYCWCDRDDCPWCAGCDCPEGSTRYLVDGVQVSFEEWVECYGSATDGLELWTPEYEAAAEKANERRQHVFTPSCDFCLGKGVFTGNGAEPGMGAPHFWYKPTNFKVWWYKYIGRDMQTNRIASPEEIADIMNRSIASVQTDGDGKEHHHA